MDSYYANPYPLSEEHYLVAWSDRHLPPHCRMDDTNQNPANAHGALSLRRLRQPESALSRPGDLQRVPDPRPRPAEAAGACRHGRLGRPARRAVLPAGRVRRAGGRAAGNGQAVADRGRAAQGPAAHEPAPVWASRRKTRASSCWAPCRSRRTGRPSSALPAASRSSSRPSTRKAWRCKRCGA